MKAFALYCGNTEPSIDELLGDPIMQVLMKRDGVPPRDVRALIDMARRRQRRSAAEVRIPPRRDLESVRL
jgi:hypothetical protein